METAKPTSLFITFVEKEGPFLKLWGQADKQSSIYVEQFLNSVAPQFDQGLHVVHEETLQTGVLVCAKYKDNKYYRARVTNTFFQEGCVEVNFLDYGNRDKVPIRNLREIRNFPPVFISILPLAQSFILAEGHSPGNAKWSESVFENLSKELKYRELQVTILAQATQHYLVKLFHQGHDLGQIFISRGLMQPVSLQAQQAVLLSMSMNMNMAMNTPSIHGAQHPPAEINTYKAMILEPGKTYPVYVSYVNDGPCHFSVQLEQSLDVLGKLMTDINSLELKYLDELPLPGTICLAKCSDDGNICRAVVTNEVDNMFKIFYVDFGNYETVQLSDLFQIPFKFVLPKVMAVRFSLAGIEKPSLTLEMQVAFKKFVDDRLLHMKVLASHNRLAIPKCELLDPKTETSALDVINRAALHAYPEPIVLHRGSTMAVKVSYVFSCSRFYVHLVNKEEELSKLMIELQTTCVQNDFLNTSSIKSGLPCSALYAADEQWYRSQIVEILNSENVKVKYIDYGNEEIVPVNQLRQIEGEQLTVLRPQAIECCLNGYQNMDQDVERDNILEELILEKQFVMKVVEMVGKKALVELIDDANYNVASLLLEKLASAKSKVSPILVQANNKIEHRKTQQGGRDYRDDRKTGREYRNYNDKPNDKSWRQEGQTDIRNRDTNSNETGKSWRQNNKGFNNNRYNERHNNRNSRNENDWNNKSPTNNDNWAITTNTDDFSSTRGDTGYSSHRDGFKKKDRFEDKGKWNSGNSKGGGFKKREYRDGSEMSSSGSEKSFQKGLRTSSRNDSKNQRFNQKSHSFNSTGTADSWNVSAVTIDAAPATAQYKKYEMLGTQAKVIISWFHHPGHFYAQVSDYQDMFKKLMQDIQTSYKDKKPEASQVGAPVIGLFPEDNVLYRAQVLEVIGNQYKVFYVDFGNVSTISKIWPIEKKFMELPAQAICCSLNGIKPVGDKWVDPDAYSSSFNKDEFVCEFISSDNGKTLVNLAHGNEDIGQLLQQQGLVELISFGPTVEIPVLLGQQFRAILKSVNNLGDIIIALQCGVALNCKVHNLETAASSYEDSLKAYIEKPLIVYVDNIIGEQLDVTFYDIQGNKLVVIEPDEGSFDTVDPLCPFLALTSNIHGFISHVEISSMFVQPSDNSEVEAQLLEQLYQHYNDSTQESPIIPDEGFVYAVHSSDGNWYRARVINFDDEKAVINFIDYGNFDNIPFTELRELAPEFYELPVLCVEVIHKTDGFAIGQEVTAKIFYGDSGWEGEVTACQTNEESLENSTAPAPEDVSSGVGSMIIETSMENQVLPVNVEETVENTIGTSVVVSHIDSPNEFYVQLTESTNAIDELLSHLQEISESLEILENPTPGVLCAAPYSADQQWYRAQVLDADDDITTVRFVDFGNTDVIDNKSTKIKTLPQNLLTLEVYATRCSLKIQPREDEWSAAALQRFEELCSADITVEFIDQDEKTNYVQLYNKGEDIKNYLINENFAVPMQTQVETSKPRCFISHINSPSEFWIQLENCADELEFIDEQLSAAKDFPELEDLTPGTLCVALFPDDEMWYRARILSNTIAGIELLFIDYGNSCTSENLRQIPEELAITNPLAQKCSLQKPEGVTDWTPESVERFQEISAEGQTIFTVQKISTGETSVVELYLEEQKLSEKLLPVTEECYVRNVKSLVEFQIEKDGVLSPEKYKLQKPEKISWSDESEAEFMAIINKDDSVFQIEFLPENTVRIYSDGVDIGRNLKTVPIEDLENAKTVDEDSSEIIQEVSKENSQNECSSDVVVDHGAGGDSVEHSNEEKDSKIEPSEEATEEVGTICDKENDTTCSIRTDPVVDSAELSPKKDLATKSDLDVKDDMNLILNDLVDKITVDKTEEETISRPSSSNSGKIMHDDKILPGAFSEPQTPDDADDKK